MRFNLKGIAKTHKRLADGKRVTYHYAWRGGPRLPGLPGSAEFMKTFHAAIVARDAEPAGAAPKPPTVSTLISQSKAAPEFTSKAEKTRSEYEPATAPATSTRFLRNTNLGDKPRWRNRPFAAWILAIDRSTNCKPECKMLDHT